jgi:hypothetical protein
MIDPGYLMMSVTFLFARTVFVGPTRLERTIRWIFIVSSVAAIAALIGLALIYGRELE